MRNLMNWIKTLGPLAKITVVLVAYSVIVIILAINFGIGNDVDLEGSLKFEGYLGKINWSLYPIWWIFLAALLHLTWDPFLAALKDIKQEGILRDRSGNSATTEQVVNLCERMSYYRSRWLLVAVVLSCIITLADTANLRKIYSACSASDFAVLHWHAGSKGSAKAVNENCKVVVREWNDELEIDFSIAYLISEHDNDEQSLNLISQVARELAEEFEIALNRAHLKPSRNNDGPSPKLISQRGNAWLNYAIYFQQVVAGVMAILVFFQLAIVCNVFWRLERATLLNKDGLKIMLDPFSNLYEYGLESWNHAWNNVYWAFAPALLVPLASKQAQAGEALDFGQIVIQFAVPVLIAFPMVATIIARQQRLPDLWQRIREEKDPERVELYHRQRLWPLDRNWVSKLGIIVSFTLLSYLLGRNLLGLGA